MVEKVVGCFVAACFYVPKAFRKLPALTCTVFVLSLERNIDPEATSADLANMDSLPDTVRRIFNPADSPELACARVLRDAIERQDVFLEVEALTRLGEMYLRKGEDTKDAAEMERAAAMYTAAHVRCADPNMAQAIEHRIRYMEKLGKDARQDSGQHQDMPAAGTPHNSVLKAAESCQTLHQGADSTDLEDRFTHTLVRAIADRDGVLEVECLKSLGDLYLGERKTRADTSQLQRAKAMFHRARSRCESPDGKQTLVHRVKFTEKLQEAATMRQARRAAARLDMASLADKLQRLESYLSTADSPELAYGRALRDAITRADLFTEVEALKSLGDVYLQDGKVGWKAAELERAAAMYAAAHVRCADPNMAQAIEHRIRYMEKLGKDSRQDSGQHQDMPAAGTPYNSVLKTAETCQTLHQGADSTHLEDRFTHTLVRAIANRDAVLEVECLKSLGDLYLGDGKTRADTS
ncbi:uncharacterized protein LOC144877622 [Branchiostoma floridae x Branchiostoma japonicum]